jgi:hypothetical protein
MPFSRLRVVCYTALAAGAMMLVTGATVASNVIAACVAALLISAMRTVWSVLPFGRELGRRRRL